jgi:hypothetical protein
MARNGESHMNSTMRFLSGVSVLFTTLAFGHIMVHDTQHMMSHHEDHQFFIIAHTIVAIALGVLSLTGAFYLLTGKGRRDSTEPNS